MIPESDEPEDLVPEGYWERLGAAFDACPRLPPQDLSQDPKVME